MNEAFREKLEAKLSGYRDWSCGRALSQCRLIQYCGVDLLGALDIPLVEVEARIKGLVREGLYVDWTEREGRLILRVWEYGGPEPAWVKSFAEEPLAEIETQ